MEKKEEKKEKKSTDKKEQLEEKEDKKEGKKEKEQMAKKSEIIENKEEIKKIVSIEEVEKINPNGEELIKIDENLKKHIEDKVFLLNQKLKINVKFLYQKISKREMFKSFCVVYSKSYAFIPYCNLGYIFFYKLIPVEFNLIYKNPNENQKYIFDICSSFEILDFCEKNKYNPYIEIDNNKYKYKNLFDAKYFNKFGIFNKIILIQDNREYDVYKNEELLNMFPMDKSNIQPDKLSKFFELYFKFETKSNFEYWESEKRTNFIASIVMFKEKEDLYCFKICGPSGIGKSLTLFLISKYYKNFLYYNLKTIRDLKNDDVKIQNILTESCKHISLNDNQIKQLSSILNNNRYNSFFICLKNILEFLIKNELLSVIILDQFKSDVIEKEQYKQIFQLISEQKLKNVKLLICSSTNDKEIREECIKSWKSNIFFSEQLNIENQNYYFYVDELFSLKQNYNENNTYDKVLIAFNGIPKYKNMFKYLKEQGDHNQKLVNDLTTIREKVEKNLNDLYTKINEKNISPEIIKMKMIEYLRYLDLHRGEKIKYEQLSEILEICSFKYYRFKFEKNEFSYDYNFPYMIEIVNKIIDTHLSDFYKYKLNEEHSGYTNSDFFELFSGSSLKKGVLELPQFEGNICLKVDEIIKMTSFSKDGLNDIIENDIYSNLVEYKIKKEKNENNNKQLEDLNLISKLKDYINYNSQNIEYYKLQYLNNIKTDYNILGNKNIGDMSIFINQKNQRGKLLDLAYVYGKKEEKVFIGFQMKAYDEESSHSSKFNPTKDSIKKALQPMIINIKYLMDMNIISWHYIVIIFYNKNKPEGKQYFKEIVNTCKNNGLEYILYEPFENKFYNRNLEMMSTFIPNEFSNLDINIDSILPINIMDDLKINQYMDQFSEYILKNKLSDANYIEEGLNSLLNKKRKREQILDTKNQQKIKEIKNILDNILNNIKMKFNFKLIKFVGAYKFINNINIPSPKKDYFFLISSKEKDIYFIVFNDNNLTNVYYKYNLELKVDILDIKKNSEIIVQIDSDSIAGNIDKKEKFYVFKIFEK